MAPSRHAKQIIAPAYEAGFQAFRVVKRIVADLPGVNDLRPHICFSFGKAMAQKHCADRMDARIVADIQRATHCA